MINTIQHGYADVHLARVALLERWANTSWEWPVEHALGYI